MKKTRTKMATSVKQRRQEDNHSSLYKWTKTVFLVLCWICMGLCGEIAGPTFVDLKIRTNTSYETIAFTVSGRSVGYFVGSVIAGFAVDKFRGFDDLIMALSVTGDGIVAAVIPWLPNVSAMYFFFLMTGVAEGCMDIVGNRLLLELWREKASSPLQVVHMGFGVGSFIIPLIANPFLAVPLPAENDVDDGNHGNNISVLTSTTDGLVPNVTRVPVMYSVDKSTVGHSSVKYLKESRIEYAYAIAGIITVIVSSVFYVYYCIGRKEKRITGHINTMKPKTTFKEILNPASCAGGRLWYGLQIFGLLAVFYFNDIGVERFVGRFIRAYSIDQLGFSGDAGSLLNSTFWISFTVGRFIAFIAARWVPVGKLILIEMAGNLLSAVLMNIFGHSSATALWVLTQPTGFFVGPMFPTGIAWGDFHVKMTGLAITFLILGGSIGGVCYMRLVGFLYDTYGPKTFLYTLQGYGILVVINIIAMTLVGRQHGDRFANQRQEEMVECPEDDIPTTLLQENEETVAGDKAIEA